MIEARSIRGDEWRRLRDIRLEALADSPGAFSTTFDEAKSYPESVWQERTADGAEGVSQITVLAVERERTVGMTVGLLSGRDDAAVVPIVAVYVTPTERRKGIAARLLELVEEWARDKGATHTSLWVAEDNDAALRFYERIGYQDTLERHKLTQEPPRWETLHMKRLTTSG